MADAAEDPIHTWALIADSAENGALLQSVIGLGTELGADVSLTLRVPGSDRYLTVSFGILGPDEEEDDDGA